MKITYRIDKRGTTAGENPIENVVETLEIAAEDAAAACELFKQHIWDECDHTIWHDYENDENSITLIGDDMQRYVIVSAS